MLFKRRPMLPSSPRPTGPSSPTTNGSASSPGRPAFGAIEMWGRDFVSGWVVSEEPGFYLEIVLGDGEIAHHTRFSRRRELEARVGAEAYGFLCAFDRRLGNGERIHVGIAGGSALQGSPFTYETGLPPDDAAASTVRVHVEKPGRQLLRTLETFVGWAILDGRAGDLSFFVDGEEQDVDFDVRPDVAKHFDTAYALGWEFTCDLSVAARQKRSVKLEAILNGRSVFERDFDAPHATGEELLLFMHIPKTAGMSLNAAIKAQPRIDSHWLYGTLRRPLMEQMSRLSPGAFADLDLLGGHFTHGLHHHIGRPCRYVAVLREPASYLKSYFLYRKYVQRWPPVQDLDIYQALDARLDHLLDNGMTRFFAPSPPGPLEPADLERAKTAMRDDFAFVGLSERMEETAARLSRLLRAPLEVRHDNRTPHHAEADEIDLEELARRAEVYLRYDRELYSLARTLFW